MANVWPTAADMMTAKPVTLPPDALLSHALGAMRTGRIHEVLVVQNRRLLGMVTLDAIARRVNLPLNTKIEHLMLLPPTVGPSTTYPEISERLLATGIRAAPVISPKDELLGLVSRTDLVRALPKISLLAERKVDEVIAPLSLTLHERDPVSTLLGPEALRHLEFHPLPVVDRKGALTGAVGVADLGEVLWRPTAEGHRDVANRGKATDVEILTIMHSPALTVPRGTTAGVAARLMGQERVSSVFVVDGGRPVGIVSQSDLIGLSVGGNAPSEGPIEDVFVQIQGLRASGDPAILAEIDQVIARGLRRIARYVHPVMLNVHFQPHASHRSGEASVQGRLNTDREILYASRTGWNFYAALNDLLDELEAQARRQKEERPHGIHRTSSRLVGDDLAEPSADPELEARIRSATPGSRRRRRR